MTTVMSPTISAPAISRIISANTNIRKAPSGNNWGIGFVVVGYGVEVNVSYQDTDARAADLNLDAIVELINKREDRKYLASKTKDDYGSPIVKVTPRQETEEDRMEQLAEESPYGVTITEVRKVLDNGRRFFEFTDKQGNKGAGFFVEREAAPNDRLVRVSYKDHPHTGYALVVDGRDGYMHAMVQRYAKALVEAGYSVLIDHDAVAGDSVLVGRAGEFGKPQEQDAEDAREPLTELRDAVESADPAFMTRKAGPTSLFVYYLVPFKDKVRRLEVVWSGGGYTVHGRFGGVIEKTRSSRRVADLLRDELAD